MKLIKDFGVRALLALIAGVGGFGALFYILNRFDLEASTLVAIIAVAISPFNMALAFYFGERKKREE